MSEERIWWIAQSEFKKEGPIRANDIHRLIDSKQFEKEDLVWRQGMSQWVKFCDSELYSFLQPPPFPVAAQTQSRVSTGAIQSNTTNAKAPEPERVQNGESAKSVRSEPAYVSHTEPSSEKPFRLESGVAPNKSQTSPPGVISATIPAQVAARAPVDYSAQPGAFRRAVARWIDLSTFSSLAALGLFALVSYGLPAQVKGPMAPLVYLAIGFGSFFIAFVFEAVVYGVFGNTLGKAIAGIGVFDSKSQERLSAGKYLSRNINVWFRGFWMGLPLLNLIGIVIQMLKISKGRAGYDEKNTVLAKSFGGGRALAMTGAFGSVLAGMVAVQVLGLTGIEDIDNDQLYGLTQTTPQPKVWSNHVTAKTVSLPGQWAHVSSEPDEYGDTLITFAVPDESEFIVMSATVVEDQYESIESLAVNWWKNIEQSNEVQDHDQFRSVVVNGLDTLEKDWLSDGVRYRASMFQTQGQSRIFWMVVSLFEGDETAQAKALRHELIASAVQGKS